MTEEETFCVINYENLSFIIDGKMSVISSRSCALDAACFGIAYSKSMNVSHD
jgi:hypothetical protein